MSTPLGETGSNVIQLYSAISVEFTTLGKSCKVSSSGCNEASQSDWIMFHCRAEFLRCDLSKGVVNRSQKMVDAHKSLTLDGLL